MRICLVIDAELPARRYGGTERVVVTLGRALRELGHGVTYLARPRSRIDFADVQPLDRGRPLEAQIPGRTDIVHLHTALPLPEGVPACRTIHGNTREATVFPPNTIFVSHSHARNHGATAFVHNGIDARDYGPVEFTAPRDAFVFLAKAAWHVKNVRGAIRVARLAGAPIDILGGHRLNFSMGFRLTLTPSARFHGMVDDAAKTPVLRRARGLIFPVLWPEPFGLAVIESLYFGVPVFATPYGSLPELVPAEAGCLSSEAARLAEAARDWESYDRRAIHAWWAQHFTAVAMARRYLEYYTSILDGEDLHPGPISAPLVRKPGLLPWS